jgi:hypothetical protein
MALKKNRKSCHFFFPLAAAADYAFYYSAGAKTSAL